MVFGKKSHFTKKHFEKNKGYAPAYLCELVVYCMELLSQLSAHDIHFRFKGGNSLLLILEEPERFSIDVDVATTESKETLIQVMEEINKTCEKFTNLEIRQHKTKPWLPMISFKIFFDSFFQKPEDAFVMLDAVLKPSPYGSYRTKVKVGDLYESKQEVEVSTPSGLIGDKLLTVGPSTLGIPIGKGKDAQRLKHVFDISRLSRKGFTTDEIKSSVLGCMAQENELQKSSFTLPEIIEDTIRFCTTPVKFNTIPNPEDVKHDPYLYEITTGFDGFRQHLFKIDYTWDMLKKDLRIVEEIMVSLKPKKQFIPEVL